MKRKNQQGNRLPKNSFRKANKRRAGAKMPCLRARNIYSQRSIYGQRSRSDDFLLNANKYQLENTLISKYTDKRRSGGLSVFVGVSFIGFPTFAVTVLPTPHGRCGPLLWPFQKILPQHKGLFKNFIGIYLGILSIYVFLFGLIILEAQTILHSVINKH